MASTILIVPSKYFLIIRIQECARLGEFWLLFHQADFHISIVISFFQNEEIFVELDELDELDRITHA